MHSRPSSQTVDGHVSRTQHPPQSLPPVATSQPSSGTSMHASPVPQDSPAMPPQTCFPSQTDGGAGFSRQRNRSQQIWWNAQVPASSSSSSQEGAISVLAGHRRGERQQVRGLSTHAGTPAASGSHSLPAAHRVDVQLPATQQPMQSVPPCSGSQASEGSSAQMLRTDRQAAPLPPPHGSLPSHMPRGHGAASQRWLLQCRAPFAHAHMLHALPPSSLPIHPDGTARPQVVVQESPGGAHGWEPVQPRPRRCLVHDFTPFEHVHVLQWFEPSSRPTQPCGTGAPQVVSQALFPGHGRRRKQDRLPQRILPSPQRQALQAFGPSSAPDHPCGTRRPHAVWQPLRHFGTPMLSTSQVAPPSHCTPTHPPGKQHFSDDPGSALHTAPHCPSPQARFPWQPGRWHVATAAPAAGLHTKPARQAGSRPSHASPSARPAATHRPSLFRGNARHTCCGDRHGTMPFTQYRPASQCTVPTCTNANRDKNIEHRELLTFPRAPSFFFARS
ncbi:hypothetical protein DIPPA_28920 [Diplonema papillatum]|nr:hypothetical protein DIPPA_28920 [Diplonema papillatum]